MSRVVDYDNPSDKDRQWAEQFTTQRELLNLADATREVQDVSVDETGERPDYRSMKVAELQAEIERRNRDYGTSIQRTGSKEELVDRLEEDDRTADAP